MYSLLRKQYTLNPANSIAAPSAPLCAQQLSALLGETPIVFFQGRAGQRASFALRPVGDRASSSLRMWLARCCGGSAENLGLRPK